VFYEHIKYIEVSCHLMREKLVNEKVIDPRYVRFHEQLADIFTKRGK
jgi:hypothetical protein